MGYHHLLELMKDTGHFVGFSPEDESRSRKAGYIHHKEPLSPEGILGVAVNALLSARPRENFFTDGKKIYWLECKPPTGSPQEVEDIIIEDVLLGIIDAAPPNEWEAYDLVDCHARLADFSYCFHGRPKDSHYFAWLNKLVSENPEIAASCIREFEERRMRRRVLRNLEYLARLIKASKSDGKPLPEFASKLEEGLVQFGYVPSK